MRTASLPLYLLRDHELAELIERATEVMTELAGESDTHELPLVITALRGELQRRGKPVSLHDLQTCDNKD